MAQGKVLLPPEGTGWPAAVFFDSLTLIGAASVVVGVGAPVFFNPINVTGATSLHFVLDENQAATGQLVLYLHPVDPETGQRIDDLGSSALVSLIFGVQGGTGAVQRVTFATPVTAYAIVQADYNHIPYLFGDVVIEARASGVGSCTITNPRVWATRSA